MKILKFGGQSLKNGIGIQQVLQIIKKHYETDTRWIIVLSARANATNDLIQLIALAKRQIEYQWALDQFIAYQSDNIDPAILNPYFETISNLLQGIYLTGDYTEKTKDQVLAQGELISLKYLHHFIAKEVPTIAVDSRLFLKAEKEGQDLWVDETESAKLTKLVIDSLPEKNIMLTTGFIASNAKEQTVTLGRNGSNYSASLIASFSDAEEIISYTHINGVYSAHPDWVPNAQIIPEIHYNEANELASFGAQILHAKTIAPLKKTGIPLRIKNTFHPELPGTLIHSHGPNHNIKAIAVQDEMALIQIQGKGLLGKKGVDATIFKAMAEANINIGVISQGSSERGISFAVESNSADLAVQSLKNIFEREIYLKNIQKIEALKNLSVVTVIGTKIIDFHAPLKHLQNNNITIHLLNNTLEGHNIGLVIPQKEAQKAVNIIHGEIFGASKKINIAIIGKGTVGKTLIEQIQHSHQQILEQKHLDLNVFAIAGSQQVIFNKNGVLDQWEQQINTASTTPDIKDTIIQFAKDSQLENLVLIDNTASTEFVQSYSQFIQAGFDLISSNKIANTLPYDSYKNLRSELKKHNKNYLYETNVGAGLPIIDTIKLLHNSGENITRIRGVFSGTLSYLFNEFSESDLAFSSWLENAIQKGYTEPDPREDLNGKDVARKLLILARELDLANEFEDILLTPLYPSHMNNYGVDTFISKISELDAVYQEKKSNLLPHQVLRYVADLSNAVQGPKGQLSVKLEVVNRNSPLGQLKGSDSIFEIYTESYGTNPITIIGAGAGAAVTARGVLGDLLRIADKK